LLNTALYETMNGKRIFSIILFLTTFVIFPVLLCAERPKTIPAIKEWRDSTGTFQFTATTRIVIDATYSQALQSSATTFADDLRSLFGYTITVVSQNETMSGDIFLSLSAADSVIGEEGYRLLISDRITITANTSTGAFYGTRTILQLLKQRDTISGGVVRDWPDYPERGLMVDVGRHYFSIQFLKNHIRELSFQKLNYFHLHLSDDQGFRIESSSHPEIVSTKYYSKAEMTSLLHLAEQYHVQIIPEFDMPGHMGWVLSSHQDLRLVSSSGTVYPSYLDLSKVASYTLVRDIVLEYLPFFPGKYFHLGADEYITGDSYGKFPQYASYAKIRYGPKALPVDLYIGFIKWINVFVKSYEKKLRIWADPWEYVSMTGAVSLDTNIVLGIWNAYQNPQSVSDSGYSFINASFHPTYITSSNGHFGDPQTMYENWAPYHHFGGWPPTYPNWSTSADDEHVLGAQVSVWCESCGSYTETVMAEKIRILLHGLSQNSWDKSGTSKLFPSYAMFISDVSNVVGREPGYIITGVSPHRLVLDYTLTLKNYPNPFNPETRILYQLPKACAVSLKVFDILGRTVTTLVDEYQRSGKHDIVWNASKESSGMYFIQLRSSEYQQTIKMLLQK